MSLWDVDENFVRGTLNAVVLAKFLPQTMGLSTNDGVNLRVEVCTPAEDFGPDHIFLDLGRAPLDRFERYVFEEFLQARRGTKYFGRQYFGKLAPLLLAADDVGGIG